MQTISKTKQAAANPEAGGVAGIPKTMRAVAIERFGGPEVLTIHELRLPVPDARASDSLKRRA